MFRLNPSASHPPDEPEPGRRRSSACFWIKYPSHVEADTGAVVPEEASRRGAPGDEEKSPEIGEPLPRKHDPGQGFLLVVGEV